MQILEIDTLKHWQRALSFQPSTPNERKSKLGLNIAFFDSRVEADPESLEVLVSPCIGVRLSRRLDGIVQITEVLKCLRAIDSIYIIGRAEEDCYWLGNSCICIANLAQYRKFIGDWSLCHSQGAIPIWLYTAAEMNQKIDPRLVEQFHQLTQCPVVALEWESQSRTSNNE